MIKFCEELWRLIAESEEKTVFGYAEMRILLMLADAAESQGNISRAYEYDKRVEELWFAGGEDEDQIIDLVPCYRRDALQKPSEAIRRLEAFPDAYVNFLQERRYVYTRLMAVTMPTPLVRR